MKNNAERLEGYSSNVNPSGIRNGIMFGRDKAAEAKARSFVAYAIEHNVPAVVVHDERGNWCVQEKDYRKR